MTSDIADPKIRRQMIDDAKDDEGLKKLLDDVYATMNGLLKRTQPGTKVHLDYAIWSAFVGEIEAEQQKRASKPGKFYFRIILPTVEKDQVLDRVVCIESGSKANAEEYMRGRTDAESWEPISRDQLPKNMEFRPSGLTPGVWESTTGFTPLPPRPTDPRDPHAKRNP
jgi:hypothetical protein